MTQIKEIVFLEFSANDGRALASNQVIRTRRIKVADVNPPIILKPTKSALDDLYAAYNRREYIHPDPLEFLYNYSTPLDLEVVGMIASSLAYGRVKQVLRSVSVILDRLGPSPHAFIQGNSQRRLQLLFKDFKHRFTDGDQVAALLSSIGNLIHQHGSLHACFAAGMRKDDKTVVPALTTFVQELIRGMNCCTAMFIPSPAQGSACKRLNLFLRWMVREDDVDPGGWSGVCPSKLIIPLDTHMHRIGRALGLTQRKPADLRTAIEITEGFRKFFPEDPVRYDFALTRLGIQDGLTWQSSLTQAANE